MFPTDPSSPYLLKNLFAACPSINYTNTGNASFIVKSSLSYNNTNSAISSVQVDFADGQGFVSMPLDIPISINYSDTGYFRWTIKATLSNSTILQCYADYYVLAVESNASSSRYNPSGTNGPVIPSWGNITALSGVHNGATISVVYSNKNRTNTLRKPLIVVENMDAYNLAPQVQSSPYGITQFIAGLSFSLPNFEFNNQLDDIAGYDLVFIDFNDGMDGIVRNASVVQESVNRVNANKVFDTRSGQLEQNVVLGMGTGGLNARYALANMAKNFGGSNTRLLITHDAPHRGSNIALSLQYLVKFINKSIVYGYNWGDIFPEHQETVKYFNANVNKDVLIYKAATEPGSSIENTFINNIYQPMISFQANTQPFKFIATSLGNECARELFIAGREFINFGEMTSTGLKIKAALSLIGSHRRLELGLFTIPILDIKFETQVSARSIPTQTTSNRIITKYTYLSKNTLFGGLIELRKSGVDEIALAPQNLLPIDGVPGSINTLLDFTELRNYQRGVGNYYFNFDEYLAT